MEKRRVQRSLEDVERVVEEYERSGLSRREFSEGRGISMQTIDHYRRRLRDSKPKRRQSKSGLLPVVVEAAPQVGERKLALVLANGRRIETGWSCADADLARLIRIAEAA